MREVEGVQTFTEPIRVTCPDCGTTHLAPPESVGKMTQCLRCRFTFRLTPDPERPPRINWRRVFRGVRWMVVAVLTVAIQMLGVLIGALIVLAILAGAAEAHGWLGVWSVLVLVLLVVIAIRLKPRV